MDDIVNEYNNTYHRTIKMKHIDVKDNTYLDFGKENNDKDLKFHVSDHVRISKYKNIFAKGYTPNWSKKIFVIKKVKNTVPRSYVRNLKKLLDPFMKKSCKKNQQEFRIEKVIKRKRNKIYVKWKGCDNSFNSWIDKNDVI